MTPLDLVGLPQLMGLTAGERSTVVALLDGPVDAAHPALTTAHIRGTTCSGSCGAACRHATFVAGILVAERGGAAPAICPGCTLLVRPIFTDVPGPVGRGPSSSPDELATAIVECVDAGAHVVNLSVGLATPSTGGVRRLDDAFDHAVRHGVIVIAAAGNQSAIGSSMITRHPWVVPVAAFGADGRPTPLSNLGSSMARRGLGAPGAEVTSIGPAGEPVTAGGTSISAPFVTGTVALLRSLFPSAPAGRIRSAVLGPLRRRRIVPPLLDAWGAYRTLSATQQAG